MALFRRIPGNGSRIKNETYQPWLAAVAGYKAAELEVVQRTLRIKDNGVPEIEPAASSWKYGQGPSGWAAAPLIQEAQTLAEVDKDPAPEKAAEIIEEKKTDPEPAVILAEETEIKAFVLNLVSEKTGYPVEILDLGLDLEADLGIDTVKQAELFAAVRENYGIPRREDLRLVDYNTLSKVIGFVMESQSQTPVETPAAPEPQEAPAEVVEAVATAPAASQEEVKTFVLNLVSQKTGDTVESLDLGLDL